MQTRLITTEPELLALKDSWDKLVRGNPETDLPFYSWDWFYASWQHFGQPEGRSLFVVAVEEENRLSGLLPLVTGSRTSSGISYRTLEFCNTGMNPRNSAYFDPVRAEPIFRAITERLWAERASWDMLELENLDESTAFHDYWADGRPDVPVSAIRCRGFTAPYIELGDSMESYLAGLSKGARKNFRTHLKLFGETEASKEIRFFKTPGDAAEGLDLVFRVRAKSWKGAFRNEHYVHFFREITPILSERGEVATLVILLDGEPIASAYALEKNGVFYGNLRDYDMNYRHLAPGILLLHFQLEELYRTGGRIFDFCGTNYDHKAKFATGMRNHSTFQIFHSGWKSRFVFSAKTRWLPLLRKLLRKPAPDDVIAVTKR